MNKDLANIPLVSVITVNYNHSEETCEMLESLEQITYPHVEFVVIDNASPSDNIEIIPERFPHVHFIRSQSNLGFAGGNNLGLEYARGEIILFLNFDSIVTPHFLEPLIKELLKDNVGMVGPKVCYYDKPNTVQFAGYTELDPITLRNRSIGYHESDQEKFSSTYDSPFIHGAAMAVRASAIKKVGLMPDIYFLYYEELDWATCFRESGFKIRFVGESTIYHKASVSTGQDSPLKIYYLARNRIIYARRHLKGFPFLLAMLFQYFLSAPKNLLMYSLKGQWSLFSAYAKGVFWHIPNILNQDVKKTKSWSSLKKSETITSDISL